MASPTGRRWRAENRSAAAGTRRHSRRSLARRHDSRDYSTYIPDACRYHCRCRGEFRAARGLRPKDLTQDLVTRRVGRFRWTGAVSALVPKTQRPDSRQAGCSHGAVTSRWACGREHVPKEIPQPLNRPPSDFQLSGHFIESQPGAACRKGLDEAEQPLRWRVAHRTMVEKCTHGNHSRGSSRT
jgi:hypothetical protein